MSNLISGHFNMKPTKKISIYFLLLLMLAGTTIYGQQENSIYPVEKVGLVTDRTLYIAGEQLQFSALINTELQTGRSKVLYAEMITPDGKREAGNKFSINNSTAHGCLLIPGDILTGIYYVRAYTKYMRNAGPESYAYVAIKIINPLSNEVLNNKEVRTSKDDVVNVEDENEVAFNISTDKNEYAEGENVNVALTSLNSSRFSGHGGNQIVCVAVVPEASALELLRKQEPISTVGFRRNLAAEEGDSIVGFRRNLTQAGMDTLAGFRRNLTTVGSSLKSMDFYPESRGVSITGQLKDGTNGNPVPGARVNLSIIGQGRDFEAMQTDSTGHYYFSLPDYTGHRDIFLCAEKDSLIKPILLVDNDFCSIPVHLPSPEFKLSTAERTAALNMARNIRLTKYFNADTLPCVNEHESSTSAFYGKPSAVLVFDQYVQLPTLEEYFNELPSAVRVRKQNGHKYFKVIGDRAEMNFFNPLVMVDWVAVNNPEKILAASPANIARIEVITVPYVKGNITYGGIVSIISKKGDFAGIDLPASGIFFNYLFLADSCHCHIPENISPELPDSRNTLYWNPAIEWDANNSASFSFKTPSTPGKYDIVLKGLESNGEVYEQRVAFEVKEK